MNQMESGDDSDVEMLNESDNEVMEASSKAAGATDKKQAGSNRPSSSSSTTSTASSGSNSSRPSSSVPTNGSTTTTTTAAGAKPKMAPHKTEPIFKTNNSAELKPQASVDELVKASKFIRSTDLSC